MEQSPTFMHLNGITLKCAPTATARARVCPFALRISCCYINTPCVRSRRYRPGDRGGEYGHLRGPHGVLLSPRLQNVFTDATLPRWYVVEGSPKQSSFLRGLLRAGIFGTPAGGVFARPHWVTASSGPNAQVAIASNTASDLCRLNRCARGSEVGVTTTSTASTAKGAVRCCEAGAQGRTCA